MKTSKKTITTLVIVPLLLLSVSVVAGDTKNPDEVFLGFTMEDIMNMVMLAVGVGALVLLAFFTTRDKKKDSSEGPVVKKHSHHHHHRIHKVRR